MKSIFKFTIRDIVEIAMFCAIAVVLDTFVKIPFAPTGGSINIAMVPLFIISLRHGPFKGFIAGGIVFGLITALIDGYGMNTYPFDYLIPFGAAGLVGFLSPYFYKNFSKSTYGCVMSIVMTAVVVAFVAGIRLLSSAVNSVLFYETSYAGGITYGLTYIPLSALISGIIFIMMLPVIYSVSNFKTSYIASINVKDNMIRNRILLLIVAFNVSAILIFILGMLAPSFQYIYESVVVLVFLGFGVVIVLKR